MMASLNRIVSSGWEKFTRDKSSSSAALFMMVIVLLVATFLFFLNGASSFLIASLQDSVDISTYLKDIATEDEIFQLRADLQDIPEVKEVRYVSKQEALERFVQTHKSDELILDSLEIVGQNPLLASLNIKAFDASQYPSISQYLENTPFSPIIANVDYHDRASVIARLSQLTQGIQSFVFLFILFSGFLAGLVAFNTIRLTIYNSRDEIEVMRLVGASNWFIRGPFISQGVIVGVLASLITVLFLFPFTLFLSFKLQAFTAGFDVFQYFFANFLWIVLLQLAVAIGLGVISSLIAIRRYLKV